MEKPNRRRTDEVLTLRNVEPAALRSPSVTMTNIDVARRAYELYVARGGDHGHNVDDDWQQAERELRDAASSKTACTGSRSSR
jgi:DUF2934 family protein